MSVQALKCILPDLLKLSAVFCAVSALGGISEQLLLSLLAPRVQQDIYYTCWQKCACTQYVYIRNCYMWVYFLFFPLKSTKIASVLSFTWKKDSISCSMKKISKSKKHDRDVWKHESTNQRYAKNFYLKQTSKQPTSEGCLIWEGILPPDSATFSEAKNGIKFEMCDRSDRNVWVSEPPKF